MGHARRRRSTPTSRSSPPVRIRCSSPARCENCSRSGWRSMHSAPTTASSRRSIAPARSRPTAFSNGDLVLVASADLTLGGRNLPDGTLAFTNFDHTESNSLGSSILTDTDPLAGLTDAGRRGGGVRHQAGQGRRDRRRPAVRAFPRAERQRPDHAGHRQRQPDRRDHPADRAGPAGERRLAAEKRRLHGQVRGDHGRGRRAARTSTLEISPDDPTVGVVTGSIPVGYVPSLPGVPTLVQTFTIADPSAYARTAFIEALAAAGVTVERAGGRTATRSAKLPAAGSYDKENTVAELRVAAIFAVRAADPQGEP